ncbi:hypothetical protein [Formosa sp. PL04]|uniref:hypothetical protein n=1 Tax=Formosa sp. PL04 TaxID=3081755 RepID=UPI0029818E7F|nr:hypothetical protein [Formosa sp. PL04]MDW5288584.1 hypothetical protein [Formosa sp. PL04]
MKNNNVLSILIFIAIGSFTIPLFNIIANGQFYWGIAPSLFIAIFFYLQGEKTKEERDLAVNSLKAYQISLENILKQSSIDTSNVINSLKEENSLSHKKVLDSLNIQTKALNNDIKSSIQSFYEIAKTNSAQLMVLESKMIESILDLGNQTINSFSNSNDRLIGKIDESFGKQEFILNSINHLLGKEIKEANIANQKSINQTQEIFTSNIISINDNNIAYKRNLDMLMEFVNSFEKNHNVLIENLSNDQINFKETVITSFSNFDISVVNMKKSFRGFNSSLEEFPSKLNDFISISKKNNNEIKTFIEDLNIKMEKVQKGYLDNSKEILEDLKELHKVDEELILNLLT